MRPSKTARLALWMVLLLLPVQLWADEAFDPAELRGAFLGRAQARAIASPRSELLLSLAALASPGGFGALATLSVPLERVAGPGPLPGKVASYIYSPPALPPPSTAGTVVTATLVGPDAARDAVAAAWRVAGLGHGDGALDSMAGRARWSALLPEARVRVLKRMSDATHSSSTSTDPETGTYYGAGEALLLEARLTWRLDRLVFADEEPAIERLRLERAEARTRVAGRTLDLLGKWQRALIDASTSTPGTADHTDALLRGVEAAIAIDVMTDGWFSRWREAGRASDDGPR